MKPLLAFLVALLISPPAAHADPKAGPTVKLVRAGSGPKKPLRYGLQTGVTATAVMRMSMAMKAGELDIVLPVIETDITINIGEKRGTDEYLMMFALDDLRVVTRAGVMPGVVEAMEGLLVKLKGMTGSGFINTRGVTRESSFLLPAGLPPEVRAMLEQTEDTLDQMSAPLPIEPVGKGARWQIVMNSETGGIKTVQTLTYDVVAISGDRVDMKVTITQTAAPQVVSTGGTSYELVSYKGKGSGTVNADMRRPVPESRVIMTVDQVALMDVGAGKQKMPTHASVEMTMARK